MRQLRAWLARFKGLFRKGARERDLSAELESHLQMHIDDNIRAGMSPQEAKRVAVMKLGGIDQTKEAYRDRATIPFLESVLQDVRFSLRQFRRNPSVTVAAVLTLSAAIGANTAIFSVVNAVLLRPLPYPNSDRVVNINFPYVEKPFGLPPAMRTMTVVVRTNNDPSSFIAPVRNELRAIDGDLPPYKVQTMEQVLAASVSKTRFTMLLLTVFSVLALILAAGGVYSVMAYSVAQRTHEIGIRNALGAQRSDIFKLIMGQGFVLAIIGVVVGGVAGLALTRVMSNLLFTVSATDPKIFIGVALLLLVVALLACYLPARRATMVDPITALRND